MGDIGKYLVVRCAALVKTLVRNHENFCSVFKRFFEIFRRELQRL